MKIKHGLMIGWVAMVAVAVPAKANWTVHDCGTLGGNQAAALGTQGLGISDNQCVVGFSTHTDGKWRAFRYTHETHTISLLSYPVGYQPYGRAYSISPDAKKVVGVGFKTGVQPAVLWTNDGTTAWAAIELPKAANSVSLFANAVNDDGIVAGSVYPGNGYTTAPLVWHPGDQGSGWTYDAATDYSFRSLPIIPSGSTHFGRAQCVTKDGLIGGEGSLNSTVAHPAVWMPDGSGGYTGYNLYIAGPTEGKTGKIYGIAWDRSIGKYRAVGSIQEPPLLKLTPWSWTYNAVGDTWDTQGSLGSLYPAVSTNAYALGVNESGTVVGQSMDAAGEPRAFVWDAEQGMRDLNDLLEGPTAARWSLRYAQAISADGCISGTGYYDVNNDGVWATDKSETRAFLLVPMRGTAIILR